MAIYTLHNDSNKSNVCLQTDHDVPENVEFIEYKESLYRRSTVLRDSGDPDPYLWEEIGPKEMPAEDAVIVSGKSLIATTSHTTTSAQRRGLNVNEDRLNGADALAAALNDANQAKATAINAQIEAEQRAIAAEKELEELKAALAAQGLAVSEEEEQAAE